SLHLIGGQGGNTFTVADTPVSTVIDSGNGADTVNVQRTTAGLTVNGVFGRDNVNLGVDNSVQAIRGIVTITNNDPSTTLTINNQAARPFVSTVQMSVGLGNGAIAGLAPADIIYRASGVRLVDIHAGGGGNTYIVHDTVGNSSGVSTQLFTSGGNNAISV